MRFATALSGLALSLGAAFPAAAGIQDIAGYAGIRVYEATYSLASATFAAGDARLVQALPGAGLSQAGRDFGFFLGNENYDLYLSDADGTLNAAGSYLTIDGNCDVPYNCFNIVEVAVLVGNSEQLASSVVRAVYGGGPQTAGSHVYAADGNLSTYTAMGDTISAYPNGRISITLAFANVPAVPEPATTALWMAGLGGVALAARRRRQAA